MEEQSYQESSYHQETSQEFKSAEPAANFAEPGVKFDDPDTHNVALVLFVASLIELIAGSKACSDSDKCEKEVAFSVALGSVSMVLTLPVIILSKLSPFSADLIAPFVSGFLFIWWVVGACVMTFRSPFNATQNGYFASWLAAMCAGYYFFTVVPHVQKFLDRIGNSIPVKGPTQKLLGAIILSSIVVMVASSIVYHDNDSDNKGQKIWGVIVGLFSTIISLVGLVAPLPEFIFKFVAVSLAVLWIAGVGVLTFDEPFLYTGNGFFASWVAFISSGYLALLHLKSKQNN